MSLNNIKLDYKHNLMDGKSLDIKKENLNKLKEFMPEVFTEGEKLDVEKLRLTLGEDVVFLWREI